MKEITGMTLYAFAQESKECRRNLVRMFRGGVSDWVSGGLMGRLLALVFLILLGSGLPVQAEEKAPLPSRATKHPHSIVLSLGFSIPPYVIADSNRGAELDIVREALALEGYKISTHYVPNKRRNIEYSNGNSDGALTVSPNEDLPGYYSKSYITYQNVAFSLEKSQYAISSIADLSGKRVVAFQTASVVLGPEFGGFAEDNKMYREVAKQRDHLSLLFNRQTDVIIGDVNILNWLVKNGSYASQTNKNQPMTIHRIFPPSHKFAVFRDQEVTRAFDRGIAALKQSGRYDDILKEYEVYFPPRDDLSWRKRKPGAFTS